LLPVSGTVLPVSGTAAAVREPTGADEVFVVETALAPLPALLELAGRVTSDDQGEALDAASLPATDLDAAALAIRRTWIGDTIRADTLCPAPGCGARIDVAFGIGDYLDHHRPRRPRGVTETPDAGWFTLPRAQVRFRIPTVADLLAVSAASQPALALSGRCIEAPEVPRALARRLDHALAALAPRLDDLIGGACPACGEVVAMRFDPLGYVLAELRNAFSGVYLEVHALAAAYGWPEQAILALPRGRRRRYASAIADGRRVA
jgi:hypothetical protein